jgi:hypothetical protein
VGGSYGRIPTYYPPTAINGIFESLGLITQHVEDIIAFANAEPRLKTPGMLLAESYDHAQMRDCFHYLRIIVSVSIAL